MTDPTQPVPYERITILRESLGEGGVTTVTIFDKARMTMTQEEPELTTLNREDPMKVLIAQPPPTVHIEIKPEHNEDGIWVHTHGSAVFELSDGGEDDGTPSAPHA